MAKILVNNVEQSGNLTPATWGELLDQLDLELAPRGEVVTVARFDGVDEPSFRHGDVIARPLDAWKTVEVTSDSPRALLSACLVDAEAGVVSMARAIERLGELFRGTDLVTANEGLAHVAEDLRALVSLTETLSGPLGIELGAIRTEQGSVEDHMLALGSMLESLVDAQQAADWLTVADILEFDLVPSLDAWQTVFATLRSHLPTDEAAAAPALEAVR
ncbi:MAG: hypothetical protein AB7O67_14855 [Vicinamibacterales bacterium]